VKPSQCLLIRVEEAYGQVEAGSALGSNSDNRVVGCKPVHCKANWQADGAVFDENAFVILGI
jgi:hypothetical protein